MRRVVAENIYVCSSVRGTWRFLNLTTNQEMCMYNWEHQCGPQEGSRVRKWKAECREVRMDFASARPKELKKIGFFPPWAYIFKADPFIHCRIRVHALIFAPNEAQPVKIREFYSIFATSPQASYSSKSNPSNHCQGNSGWAYATKVRHHYSGHNFKIRFSSRVVSVGCFS